MSNVYLWYLVTLGSICRVIAADAESAIRTARERFPSIGLGQDPYGPEHLLSVDRKERVDVIDPALALLVRETGKDAADGASGPQLVGAPAHRALRAEFALPRSPGGQYNEPGDLHAYAYRLEVEVLALRAAQSNLHLLARCLVDARGFAPMEDNAILVGKDYIEAARFVLARTAGDDEVVALRARCDVLSDVVRRVVALYDDSAYRIGDDVRVFLNGTLAADLCRVLGDE
jgi:hypothetical protein